MKMLNRVVARNTTSPVRSAKMFVTPPSEENATIHPVASAGVGGRCRRIKRRRLTIPSQPRPAIPARPR
jgi:hypothetical protein